jgi:hypothetical protein
VGHVAFEYNYLLMRTLINLLVIYSLLILPIGSIAAFEKSFVLTPKTTISAEVVEFFTMSSAEAGEVNLKGNKGGFGESALTIFVMIAIGLVALQIVQNAERISKDMMAFLAGAAIFLFSEFMHTAKKIDDKTFEYQDDGNNDQIAAFNKEIDEYKEIEEIYKDKAKFQTAATVAFGAAAAIAAYIYLKKKAAREAANFEIDKSIAALQKQLGECSISYLNQQPVVAPTGETIPPGTLQVRDPESGVTFAQGCIENTTGIIKAFTSMKQALVRTKVLEEQVPNKNGLQVSQILDAACREMVLTNYYMGGEPKCVDQFMDESGAASQSSHQIHKAIGGFLYASHQRPYKQRELARYVAPETEGTLTENIKRIMPPYYGQMNSSEQKVILGHLEHYLNKYFYGLLIEDANAGFLGDLVTKGKQKAWRTAFDQSQHVGKRAGNLGGSIAGAAVAERVINPKKIIAGATELAGKAKDAASSAFNEHASQGMKDAMAGIKSEAGQFMDSAGEYVKDGADRAGFDLSDDKTQKAMESVVGKGGEKIAERTVRGGAKLAIKLAARTVGGYMASKATQFIAGRALAGTVTLAAVAVGSPVIIAAAGAASITFAAVEAYRYADSAAETVTGKSISSRVKDKWNDVFGGLYLNEQFFVDLVCPIDLDFAAHGPMRLSYQCRNSRIQRLNAYQLGFKDYRGRHFALSSTKPSLERERMRHKSTISSPMSYLMDDAHAFLSAELGYSAAAIGLIKMMGGKLNKAIDAMITWEKGRMIVFGAITVLAGLAAKFSYDNAKKMKENWTKLEEIKQELIERGGATSGSHSSISDKINPQSLFNFLLEPASAASAPRNYVMEFNSKTPCLLPAGRKCVSAKYAMNVLNPGNYWGLDSKLRKTVFLSGSIVDGLSNSRGVSQKTYNQINKLAASKNYVEKLNRHLQKRINHVRRKDGMRPMKFDRLHNQFLSKIHRISTQAVKKSGMNLNDLIKQRGKRGSRSSGASSISESGISDPLAGAGEFESVAFSGVPNNSFSLTSDESPAGSRADSDDGYNFDRDINLEKERSIFRIISRRYIINFFQ